jgi:hypothetical protein
MDNSANLVEKVPADFRGFVYLLSGKLSINASAVAQRQAYFFEHIDELDIKALSDSHFMFCMGRPHGEPIRQYGPFVD